MRLLTFRAMKKHTVVLAMATLNAIEVVQVTIPSLTRHEPTLIIFSVIIGWLKRGGGNGGEVPNVSDTRG